MEQCLNRAVEGLALALCAWAVARPRLLDAAWRCRVWSAALLGLALLMAEPLVILLTRIGIGSVAPGPTAVLPALGATAAAPASPAALLILPPMAVPVVPFAIAWAGVVAWRLGVLSTAVLRIRTARHAAVPFPADREARLAAWNGASRGRFALVVSERVAAASMLGFGRPMIAVPPAWIESLEETDLDTILLHELAHAERRDDLAQLLQELLVTACWFHPAAWWIARRIRFEREAACDEQAARATTIRGYARCLVTVAAAVGSRRWASPMLVPSSVGRPSQLGLRVERVVRVSPTRRVARSRAVATLAAAVTGALLIEAQDAPRPFGTAFAVGPAGGAPERTAIPEAGQEQKTPRTPIAAAAVPRGASSSSGRRARALAPRSVAATAGQTTASAAGDDRPRESATPTVVAGPPEPLVPSASWDRLAWDTVLPAGSAATGALRAADPSPYRSPGVAGPFRAAGSALFGAGRRAGHWFSRAGVSIAEGVTPR